MLSSCKLLGVRSFVSEVRSRSGNDVPVNLHQTNVILCSDKKGQGPKAQPSPCEVQVLAKRRQVSVGSSLGARFPGPAQLSSLREPKYGVGERQVPQTVTQADCHCHEVTEAGVVRGSLPPQGLGLVSRWSW